MISEDKDKEIPREDTNQGRACRAIVSVGQAVARLRDIQSAAGRGEVGRRAEIAVTDAEKLISWIESAVLKEIELESREDGTETA